MSRVERKEEWTERPGDGVGASRSHSSLLLAEAWWPNVDRSGVDLTDKSPGFTLNGTITQTVAPWGQALAFTAAGLVGRHFTLFENNNDYSLAILLRPTSVSGLQWLLRQWESGGSGPALYSNGANIIFQIGSSANRIESSTSPLAVGRTSLIVVTARGSDLAMYHAAWPARPTLLASGTKTRTNGVATELFTIGSQDSRGSVAPLNAAVGDVRIWSRALSTDDVIEYADNIFAGYEPRAVTSGIASVSGNAHNLSTSATAAAASVASAEVVHSHALSKTDVVSAAEPASTTVAQPHTLAAAVTAALSDMADASPEQVHAMSQVSTTASADVGSASLSHSHALTLNDATASAVLNGFAVDQGAVHDTAVPDMAAGADAQSIAVAQSHAETAAALSAAADVESVGATLQHALVLGDVSAQAVSDEEAISQGAQHNLTISSTAASADMPAPTLVQVHATANDAAAAASLSGAVAATQMHLVAMTDVAVVADVPSADLDQGSVHHLTTNDSASTADMPTIAAVQVQQLSMQQMMAQAELEALAVAHAHQLIALPAYSDIAMPSASITGRGLGNVIGTDILSVTPQRQLISKTTTRTLRAI